MNKTGTDFIRNPKDVSRRTPTLFLVSEDLAVATATQRSLRRPAERNSTDAMERGRRPEPDENQ